MAWLGGLPGPHPSWAATSIPPQLSHWLGSGLPLRPCPLLWQPTNLPIYSQLQADQAGTIPHRGSCGALQGDLPSQRHQIRELRGSLAEREGICKNNYRGFSL